tara:strand:- start:343 stop:1155 length:813 start_codon:yes stop_codon:yes gene_type:complete
MEGETNPTFSLQASGATPKAPADVHEQPLHQGQPDMADQGMSARAAADQAAEENLLAGKFKTQAELERGYLEAQKKLSSPPKTAEMGVQQIIENAGLTEESIVNNWINDGKLSEEQYQAFEQKNGIHRSLVDDYLRNQFAAQDAEHLSTDYYNRAAQQLAGGEEEWNSLQKWYVENHTQEQVQAMDKKLGDKRSYQGAIKEMLWDWKQAVGQGLVRPLVEGQQMPNTTSGFNSVQEFVAAISAQKQQGRYDANFLKRVENTPAHITKGVM